MTEPGSVDSKRAGHAAPAPVIRRVRRERHEGHGGAWKVAFADFTLSMMALFMVLWIISAASPEQRRGIASSFSGKSRLNGGTGVFDAPARRPSVHMPEGRPEADRSGANDAGGEATWRERMREVAERVQREAQARGMSGNVDVVVGPRSLRISIHDSSNNGMFAHSSDQMYAPFANLLAALVPVLQQVEEPLILLGHTDGTLFVSPGTWANNWALSSRRALRAREILLRNGLPESRLYQVSGMGASQPVVKDNPNHASNRRIELVLVGQRTREGWQQILDANGMSATAPPTSMEPIAVPPR